jgi:hypothetical protein
MHIEQPHTLGREVAKSRIDQFLDRLVANPPGGVTITGARRDWDGDRMNFAFTAAKGFLGTSIAGVMHVTDDLVVVESELPALVRNLLGEDRIRHAVATELGAMLNP